MLWAREHNERIRDRSMPLQVKATAEGIARCFRTLSLSKKCGGYDRMQERQESFVYRTMKDMPLITDESGVRIMQARSRRKSSLVVGSKKRVLKEGVLHGRPGTDRVIEGGYRDQHSTLRGFEPEHLERGPRGHEYGGSEVQSLREGPRGRVYE